jgi:ribonuclease HI
VSTDLNPNTYELSPKIMVNFAQINLGRRHTAAVALNIRVESEKIGIVLIQEPFSTKSIPCNISGGKMFYSLKGCDKSNNLAPRAAIWIEKSLAASSNPFMLNDLSNRDMTTLQLSLKDKYGKKWSLLISSLYLPQYDDSKLIKNPTLAMQNLIDRSRDSKLSLIIGMDSNAHSSIWGCPDDNIRGEKLSEFMISNNFDLANKGSANTFVSAVGKSIIDLTWSKGAISKKIKNWNVDLNPSQSDHLCLRFKADLGSVTPRITRCKKKTDWKKYSIKIEEKLSIDSPQVSNADELDLYAESFDRLVISSYEECCKSKINKTRFHNDWFDSKLLKERRGLWDLHKKIENIRKKTNHSTSHLNLKLAFMENKLKENSKAYSNNLKKAKSNKWIKCMNEIELTKDIARIHKFFGKDKASEVSSLKKTDGSYTHDIEETVELLMSTHFPLCKKLDGDTFRVENTSVNYNDDKLDKIKGLISDGKIEWAINSLSPYKSPGGDGIFPALLQRAGSNTRNHIKALFYHSLALNHIPSPWRETFVTFIPKAGKTTYDETKAYRPISLMSFMLKSLEKIIDSKIREENLIAQPISPAQHAYQKGKGCESALHALTYEIEKSLDQGDYAVAIFIDIEGAFDNTAFYNIAEALRSRNIEDWTINWIESMLKSRKIKATMQGSEYKYNPTRGCPQGGCLSPLLWCLVMDPLIKRLQEEGFIVIGYADDLTIIIKGKFITTVCDRANVATEIIERWCDETGLSVNPSKSSVMCFTNKRKVILKDVKLFNSNIAWTNETKSLGVIIDNKLNWGAHIKHAINKGIKALWALKPMISLKWGLKPKHCLWVYKQIVLAKVIYCCLVWWHAALDHAGKLNSLQRMALRMITGATSTTPTAVLEALLDVLPLVETIKLQAINACHRLSNKNLWKLSNLRRKNHGSILKFRNKYLDENHDDIPPATNNNKRFRIVENKIAPDKHLMYSPNQKTNWFVDGSSNKTSSAIGIYNHDTKTSIKIRLSDNCSAAQAEIIAISECARICSERELNNHEIHIYTDCLNSLKTLEKYLIFKKSVLTCCQRLNKLGVNNIVSIVWCPKKTCNLGLMMADKLAKEGIRDPIIIKCGNNNDTTTLKSEVSIHKETREKWKDKVTKMKSSLAHLYPIAYSRELTNEIIKFDRANTRTLFIILTGHGLVAQFLKIFKKINNDICRLCHSQKETIAHLVLDCSHTKPFKHILELAQRDIDTQEQGLIQYKAHSLIKFAKASGIAHLINTGNIAAPMIKT